MTPPTRSSWEHAPFLEPAQEAPTTSQTRRRSGADTFNFAMSVTWLVLLQSSVMTWTNSVTGVNTFYPFVTFFVAYFLLFRARDLIKVTTYFQVWIWALTVVYAIILYQAGGGDEYAGLAMKHRIVFFSSLAGSALVLLDPERKRMLRTSSMITLAIAIPMFFFELVVPNVFSTAPGRSAGFYQNPNDATSAILLCLLFIIDLRRPTTRSLLLVSLAFAAIIITFSRQGILFAAMLWLYYSLIPGQRGSLSSGKRALVVAGVVLAGLIGGVVVARNVELTDDALMRVYSIIQGDVSDPSSLSRLDKAQEALDAMMKSPFSGRGVGAVERLHLAPHNTFLFVGVDYGVGGILVYSFILLFNLGRALLMGWERGSTAIVVALLLIYMSIFTHYVHSTPFFVVAFAALAVDALIEPRRPRGTAASPSEHLAPSYGLRPT